MMSDVTECIANDTNSTHVKKLPGQVAIKPEFVLPYPVRVEHQNTDNNKIHTQEKNEKDENLEPPVPKKKKKGQNKARPRTVPKVLKCDRLCPKILQNEECEYGINCTFSHDIEKYLLNKPSDIGDECVNYNLTGKCRYGITCRFSKKHIDENNKNIFDNDKNVEYVNNNFNKNDNSLSKETLTLLRKKNYSYSKSDHYMASLNGKNGNNIGPITEINLKPNEKKKVNFRDKLYLAPLTTVGNLPFRRVCKRFGADITCGEMAMSTQLLQGHQSEWALLRRHQFEDVFGVQLCGGYPDTMTKTAEMLNRECDIDFIDINLGCPIDLVFKKGEGSALMGRLNKLKTIVEGMVQVSDVPITIKMRTGIYEGKSIAHKVIPMVKEWGVDLITLHGRSREQRYTRAADWEYINECSKYADPVPFFGNGDILSYEDVLDHRANTDVSGCMIARGALMKPWIFTEIKEQRHWDITSNERFDMLKDFTKFGLEHWGSDTKGVENTRRFLLEWLSFLHRYIPVGLLEVVPQKINEKPPLYHGRNDLETLFASRNASDWVKISEMLLGPVPDSFNFIPKHKANSYSGT